MKTVSQLAEILLKENKALLAELEKEREHSRQLETRITDIAESLLDIYSNQQCYLIDKNRGH